MQKKLPVTRQNASFAPGDKDGGDGAISELKPDPKADGMPAEPPSRRRLPVPPLPGRVPP